MDYFKITQNVSGSQPELHHSRKQCSEGSIQREGSHPFAIWHSHEVLSASFTDSVELCLSVPPAPSAIVLKILVSETENVIHVFVPLLEVKQTSKHLTVEKRSILLSNLGYNWSQVYDFHHFWGCPVGCLQRSVLVWSGLRVNIPREGVLGSNTTLDQHPKDSWLIGYVRSSLSLLLKKSFVFHVYFSLIYILYSTVSLFW